MRSPTAWARFDDLRAGEALEFGETAFELLAERPEQVVPVLDELGRATADGWWAFGFLAYEAAAGLDASLPVHEPVDGLPVAWFGVCPPPRAVPCVRPADPRSYRFGEWSLAWGPERHRQQVEAVRRHIAAGETYQCNLTTRLTAPAAGDLAAFYADLALAQGGAYNAYLDLGRFAIASASPELFVEVADRDVRMRPMKGTARRVGDPEQDAAAVERLRTSPKERAENVMIVDLVRNDLARVAETGSVAVTSLCRVERYETVHQLTSEIIARLRPEVGLAELFRSLFPCGSVTGAPKPRTMALIRDLEDGPRGIYCGSVGVVAPPGTPVRARFNVAIRTVLVDRATGLATYGTGGGVTWDSDPTAEYAELLAKAEVLVGAERRSGQCLDPGAGATERTPSGLRSARRRASAEDATREDGV
ncbi:aminodeoxychorismate synthase component I [Actinophytocola xanthii]|uniref:aminodeoxychorismate synthase component I n=1 Tax=Actinophytocola xanthii TaxID=1912961 RepID=UPI0009FA0B59|nr:aminodeoxychorismate synthase component I [Actinophytocola xanthii]